MASPFQRNSENKISLRFFPLNAKESLTVLDLGSPKQEGSKQTE